MCSHPKSRTHHHHEPCVFLWNIIHILFQKGHGSLGPTPAGQPVTLDRWEEWVVDPAHQRLLLAGAPPRS